MQARLLVSLLSSAFNGRLLKIILMIFLFFIVIIVIFVILFALFLGAFAKNSTQNIINIDGLGMLSEKYESNGNPGMIADNQGDIGGKSYGAWQIASKVGSMETFLGWLSGFEPDMYSKLYTAKVKDNGYGTNFDNTWRYLAKDKEHFYNVQWAFIKFAYYDKFIDYFKKRGVDFEKRSLTLRNVIWSTSVQHGWYGAISIFKMQNLILGSDLNEDAQLITNIYDERKKVNIHFSGSSGDIKTSVYNRFIKEKADALKMLRQEVKEKIDG